MDKYFLMIKVCFNEHVRANISRYQIFSVMQCLLRFFLFITHTVADFELLLTCQYNDTSQSYPPNQLTRWY